MQAYLVDLADWVMTTGVGGNNITGHVSGGCMDSIFINGNLARTLLAAYQITKNETYLNEGLRWCDTFVSLQVHSEPTSIALGPNGQAIFAVNGTNHAETLISVGLHEPPPLSWEDVVVSCNATNATAAGTPSCVPVVQWPSAACQSTVANACSDDVAVSCDCTRIHAEPPTPCDCTLRIDKQSLHSTATVVSVTPGAEYEFSVARVNARGAGPATGGTRNVVTDCAAPTAPLIDKGAAKRGKSGNIVVAWVPPVNPGLSGGCKTHYVGWHIRADNDGIGVGEWAVGPPVPTPTDTSLQHWIVPPTGSIVFSKILMRIEAVSCQGTASSANTSAVDYYSQPTPPQGVRVEPINGNTALRVRWERPESGGGAAITSYGVSVVGTDVNLSVDAPALSTVIANLKFGRSYNITVRASNLVGPSECAYPARLVYLSGPSPPPTPTNVSLARVADTPNSVDVLWSAHENSTRPLWVRARMCGEEAPRQYHCPGDHETQATLADGTANDGYLTIDRQPFEKQLSMCVQLFDGSGHNGDWSSCTPPLMLPDPAMEDKLSHTEAVDFAVGTIVAYVVFAVVDIYAAKHGHKYRVSPVLSTIVVCFSFYYTLQYIYVHKELVAENMDYDWMNTWLNLIVGTMVGCVFWRYVNSLQVK